MPGRSKNPRCERCLQRGQPCLCPDIRPVQSRLEVVILRHSAEAQKQTGTARWAALALGCQMIDYAVGSVPFDERVLPLEEAWVLFPSGEPTPPPARPPRRLIVPDGTWQQARRMMLRVPKLLALPKLVLGEVRSGPRLRKPHLPEGMSTLEAIAGAFDLCGEPEPGAALRDLYQRALDRQERFKGPWRHYGQ
jgi:DTW domain-containing protein